jgi:hypothetical protein
MTRYWHLPVALLAVVLICPLMSAQEPEKRGSRGKGRRPGRPSKEEVLRRFDKNGDGKLTGMERRAAGAAKAAKRGRSGSRAGRGRPGGKGGSRAGRGRAGGKGTETGRGGRRGARRGRVAPRSRAGKPGRGGVRGKTGRGTMGPVEDPSAGRGRPAPTRRTRRAARAGDAPPSTSAAPSARGVTGGRPAARR